MELPPQVLRARDGTVLLTPWELAPPAYVRHAFDQLRRAVASHPHVAVVLARTLHMLIDVVEEEGRPAAREELRRQLDLTLEGVERSGLLHEDVERVREAATWTQCPARAYAAEPFPPLH
jgi:uncharacterized membrane protein